MPEETPEQTQAFQSKFWALHVDSQRRRANKLTLPSAAASGSVPASRQVLLDSSADPEPDAAGIPFQQRIRSGMVVSWRPPVEYAPFSVGGKSYAMVMCPVRAVGERVRDVRRVSVKNGQGEETDEGKGEAYLCALVAPSLLPGLYGISLWRQVVVRVDEMEAEVLLEWDEATRYYYMTV